MTRKRPTLTDMTAKASSAFLRLNPQISAEPDKPAVSGPPSGKRPAARKAPTDATRLERCNKTEMRLYREILMRDTRFILILPQPPRFFELTGGGTYTPDFLALTAEGPTYVYEVKGGYCGPGWEQGRERYRRAAFEWNGPAFQFVLAEWRAKEHTWDIKPWIPKTPVDGPPPARIG